MFCESLVDEYEFACWLRTLYFHEVSLFLVKRYIPLSSNIYLLDDPFVLYHHFLYKLEFEVELFKPQVLI